MKHCAAMARAGAATEARRERGGAATAVPRDGRRVAPRQVQGARARRALPHCGASAHGSSGLQFVLLLSLRLSSDRACRELHFFFPQGDTKCEQEQLHPGQACAAGGFTVSARARRRPAQRTPSSAWCRRTRTCCALYSGSSHALGYRLEVFFNGVVL